MTELSLRPYPGKVFVCHSWKELRKKYEKLLKEPYPYNDEDGGGRFIKLEGGKHGLVYLVYGNGRHVIAHELSHVLLDVFSSCGIDPREAKGEPFCYMLSQLILEIKNG